MSVLKEFKEATFSLTCLACQSTVHDCAVTWVYVKKLKDTQQLLIGPLCTACRWIYQSDRLSPQVHGIQSAGEFATLKVHQYYNLEAEYACMYPVLRVQPDVGVVCGSVCRLPAEHWRQSQDYKLYRVDEYDDEQLESVNGITLQYETPCGPQEAMYYAADATKHGVWFRSGVQYKVYTNNKRTKEDAMKQIKTQAETCDELHRVIRELQTSLQNSEIEMQKEAQRVVGSVTEQPESSLGSLDSSDGMQEPEPLAHLGTFVVEHYKLKERLKLSRERLVTTEAMLSKALQDYYNSLATTNVVANLKPLFLKYGHISYGDEDYLLVRHPASSTRKVKHKVEVCST